MERDGWIHRVTGKGMEWHASGFPGMKEQDRLGGSKDKVVSKLGS